MMGHTRAALRPKDILPPQWPRCDPGPRPWEGPALSTPAAERRIDRLLALYERDHLHPTNRLLHFIAVPLIYLCVVALLAEIPVPQVLESIPGGWNTIAAIPVSIYYLRRSVTAWVIMVLFTALCVGVINLMRHLEVPVWSVALGLLLALSIVQYIGHRIEGKRPSFFADVQFLLIGPVWVFQKLLQPLGLRY